MDAYLHPSGRARQIKLSLTYRKDLDTVISEYSGEFRSVTRVTSQAIPTPEDHASNLTVLHLCQHFAHGRSFQVLARPSLIFEDLHVSESSQTGKFTAPLLLGVRRKISLVVGRNPDVNRGSHRRRPPRVVS